MHSELLIQENDKENSRCGKPLQITAGIFRGLFCFNYVLSYKTFQERGERNILLHRSHSTSIKVDLNL